MSKLTFFDTENAPEPRLGQPLPERLVEGDPRFKTWDISATPDGRVRAGIWEATPGAYQAIKGSTWEFCTILSGVSELVESGLPPRRIEAGDSFVMQPGFEGVWRVIETTRKLWVSQD
ncbi:cupin domain-containing protein [Lichenihabitans psoromatis]|uniref:cupin domain-containing protein n=1 Tax=Lichenihabitans psoromatis TaxID=2528642 RepID=UPI0010358350|nr:cupin domain-containing protein [Lichenihabitans psoromatis]